ncbi:MAG: glucosamine-6-phosphate isomerase [Bacteroides sp. SM23_62_1]|nr:MAG: glucosamine-6-phosphate isomerase [Bacteroides sp. SM23_62_1]
MMPFDQFTSVEQAYIRESGIDNYTTKIPYILVDNFPSLGKLVAYRFLEWIAEHPEGVISLPTGKTPEYFIKWTKYLLDNWDDPKASENREKYGLSVEKKPEMGRLKFVQIDEFYPISPKQHNSFYYYVNKFYVKGFGLDPQNALLINCDQIPLAGGKSFSEIFPENIVDIALRYREAVTDTEKKQQESIFLIDQWCSEYERKLREMGGIGFFLGGIGPDGHIAFNTRGSDHHSATRLTSTNFETQAVAAADLGGIEISRKRLVITIGLGTITYNPDAVAIIFAAGESKAEIVKQSLENEPVNLYPATVLQKLKNSRFYITRGAAIRLEDSKESYYKSGEWTHQKTEKTVLDLCKKLDKYGIDLSLDDLKECRYCSLIPGLNDQTVKSVMNSIEVKINKGLQQEREQVYLHTGPHHDDIMLGILPHISHQLRSASNQFHFAVLTSGFTAVTNTFLLSALKDTRKLLDAGRIEMTKYDDFFENGYKYKWDKDVYHYLNKVAAKDPEGQRRGLCHRIVRNIVELSNVKSIEELREQLSDFISVLRKSYNGEKNPPDIQKLKGMIREFEEELVWAHFGVQVKNTHHLRLGFYTGDIFTEQPTKQRDVEPVLKLIRDIEPTVISLALDPEGSGPDTHYKVLQVIAEALRIRKEETDLSRLRIWGYRNVWYRFHPADADVFVPVSLTSLGALDNAFRNCYVSQVDASFPSYEYDGTFSGLAQKIWVEQLKDIQLLMEKSYFYQNSHPRIRAAHGMLYFKELTVDQFLEQARELEKSMEG